ELGAGGLGQRHAALLELSPVQLRAGQKGDERDGQAADRVELANGVSGDHIERAGPEQGAGNQVADDLRLVELLGQLADRICRENQEPERQQGFAAPGRRAGAKDQLDSAEQKRQDHEASHQSLPSIVSAVTVASGDSAAGCASAGAAIAPEVRSVCGLEPIAALMSRAEKRSVRMTDAIAAVKMMLGKNAFSSVR